MSDTLPAIIDPDLYPESVAETPYLLPPVDWPARYRELDQAAKPEPAP